MTLVLRRASLYCGLRCGFVCLIYCRKRHVYTQQLCYRKSGYGGTPTAAPGKAANLHIYTCRPSYHVSYFLPKTRPKHTPYLACRYHLLSCFPCTISWNYYLEPHVLGSIVAQIQSIMYIRSAMMLYRLATQVALCCIIAEGNCRTLWVYGILWLHVS